MITVGAIPIDEAGNPYISLLYTALRVEGVAIREADLRPWRVYSEKQRYDVLHIHWPEYVMAGPETGLGRSARVTAGAMALRHSVQVLRSRGVRIVWTAHNIRPHDPSARAIQVGLYRWLAQKADAVIVHTHYAANLVREQLGRRGPMYLARHGNYIGAYALPSTGRDTLRARYGFGETDHVLLAFGQIRAYKRLSQLVRDFVAFAPPSAHLIIAGSPKDPDAVRKLREMAATTDRVLLLDRRIPDAEVGELYALTDLAIFNYPDMFSSGALMLAFSMGVAALAPQQGPADELVGEPALFGWEKSPFEVLSKALTFRSDVRQRAALATAETYGWADAADIHLRAYTGAAPNL